MVKGNIHQREIVHESPSVELGLYTIRLSVKCYKINEQIYNHIKKIEHSVLVHQLKEVYLWRVYPVVPVYVLNLQLTCSHLGLTSIQYSNVCTI